MAGLDITGFTSVTMTSVDLDNYADTITMCLNLSVSYVEPSCTTPTDLTVSGISASGAVVSWVSDGTQFMIEIQLAGVAQGTPNTGTVVNPSVYVIGDVDPYPLTSVDLNGYLTPGTSYDIYVVNVCGADSLSEYSGPLTLTTHNEAACGETVVYDQVASGDYTVSLSGGNPASVTINANIDP